MASFFTFIIILYLFIGVIAHDTQNSRNLVLGGAVNVFGLFGDLSVTMRVAPRNDTNPLWLFKKPAHQIFKHKTKSEILDTGKSMSGKFEIDVCRDLNELYASLFRDIHIEGLDEAWGAISRSWTPLMIQKKLGIPEKFQGEDYGYVIIRVTRYVETATLRRHNGIDAEVKKSANKIVPQEDLRILEFIRNYGSHYISSYTIGNSLFQVLIYLEEELEQLKLKLEGKQTTTADIGTLTFQFPPEFMGPILSLSGNITLNQQASFIFSMPPVFHSLLQLHKKPEKLEWLRENLGAEALVKLRLRSIDSVLAHRPQARHWFKEKIHNLLRLYDGNI